MNEKMSGMTVVATFNDAEKSEAVKDRLEKEGIHAATFDESKLQRFWFLCRPLANHRVCVKDEDTNKARQFLKNNRGPFTGADLLPAMRLAEGGVPAVHPKIYHHHGGGIGLPPGIHGPAVLLSGLPSYLACGAAASAQNGCA